MSIQNTQDLNNKESLWNRYFLILTAASLFAGFCNQFFNATLSLHIEALGGTSSSTGLGAMFMTIASGCSQIFGGKLADRKSRRAVAITGYLVFGLASLAFAFTSSIPVIIALRTFQGVGMGLAGVSVMAAIADVVPTGQLNTGMGVYGVGGALAQAVGPGIGLLIYNGTGEFSSVAAMASVTLFLATGIVGGCRYEKSAGFASHKLLQQKLQCSSQDKEPAHHANAVFEKSAVSASVVNFFAVFPSGLVYSFLTLFAIKESIENQSLFFTFSAIAIIAARLITGHIADKYGTLNSLVPGFLLGIFSFLGLLLATEWAPGYYIAGFLYGLSTGITAPVLNAEALRRSPASHRGAASATFQMPAQFSIALSSLLCGVFIDHISYTFTFLLCAAMITVSLLLSLYFFRRGSKSPARN